MSYPLNAMDITRTVYGAWNGGRYMRFGEALEEARFVELVQLAYSRGVRTFLSADVFGEGAADILMGKALKGFQRNSYCLVGMIGHDFYKGQSTGQKGFMRFTDPRIRGTSEYADYIHMATEKALERCGTTHFDCLMLHNPDFTGYASDAVWRGMERMKDQKLVGRLGIAPGPESGFIVDLLLNFERFGSILDWAMVPISPLTPWPTQMILRGAEKFEVKLLTRGVDYGGLFFDEVKTGLVFGEEDHRSFWPQGWLEAGAAKMERLRPVAERCGLTMFQLACLWNLSQEAVESVIPTLIQEVHPNAKAIEAKVDELADIPLGVMSAEDMEEIALVGDNKGTLSLKGGSPEHTGAALADRWLLNAELLSVAKRWGIDPEVDLRGPAPEGEVG